MNSADWTALSRVVAIACGVRPQPHPHLKIDDLSREVGIMVGRAVFRLLDERDKRGAFNVTDSMAYLIVLDWFGVDCPHVWNVELIPPPLDYTGPLVFKRKGRYAAVGPECIHCGVLEIRRPPGRD